MLLADPTLIRGVGAQVLEEAGTPALVERALLGVVRDFCRTVVKELMESLDPGDSFVEDSVVWKRVNEGTRTYETIFGPVDVERGVFRCRRNGPTRCPAEERFGVNFGCWSQEASRLCSLLLTDLTSRGAARFLAEQGLMSPSRTKLQTLPTQVAAVLEEHGADIDAELRRSYDIPSNATAVTVSLDGVMVKQQRSNREERVRAAKREGRKVGGPIGSSEASVGALSFYDADGRRLMTRRFARMPEAGKVALKAVLRSELARVRDARPDLKVVATSDGAPNHWSFLASLEPDHEVVDAYHTLEHVKRRLDRTLGVNTHANQAEYARLKQVLLTETDGHAAVFATLDAIEKRHGKFKPRKRKGRGAQPTFYERHSGRMPYLEHRQLNLPIGSGVIEGTARYMVVDRLRRTGMRWKSRGGQGVLSLRQYAANDQFNHAWQLLMAHRHAA